MVENISVVYVITHTVKRDEKYNFSSLTKTKIVRNDTDPLFRSGRIEYKHITRKEEYPEKKVSHSAKTELGSKLAYGHVNAVPYWSNRA